MRSLLVIFLVLAPSSLQGQSILRALPKGLMPGGSLTLRYRATIDFFNHVNDSLVAEVLFAGTGPEVLDVPLRREGRWFVGSRNIPTTARALFVRVALGDSTDDRHGHCWTFPLNNASGAPVLGASALFSAAFRTGGHPEFPVVINLDSSLAYAEAERTRYPQSPRDGRNVGGPARNESRVEHRSDTGRIGFSSHGLVRSSGTCQRVVAIP